MYLKKYKFSVLLLNLFSTILAIADRENDPDSESFPLVLVKHKGELKYPTKIKKIRDEPEFAITGDVKFTIDDHGHQIFFCAADTKKTILIQKANLLLEHSRKLRTYYGQSKISESCLFKKSFKKRDVVKCVQEATPRIYPVQNDPPNESKQKSCGPNNEGRLYRFVYDICPPRKFFNKIDSFFRYIRIDAIGEFIQTFPYVYEKTTIYEICYNLQLERTIYTRHEIPSPRLLKDENLIRERSQIYPLSSHIYGILKFFFMRTKAMYEWPQSSPTRANQSPNLAESSRAGERRFPYKPQLLVPPDDMMTDLLRKPTFHYINTAPMHEDLVELWEYIGELIRKNLKNADTPYQVYTTAAKHPAHLENTLIPDIWIKLVYLPSPKSYLSPSLVIVMKNIADYGEVNILDQFCFKDHCTSFKKQDEVYKKFSYHLQRVRCCPLNENIQNTFPIDLSKGLLLEVPYLTDIVRSPSLIILNRDKS